MPCFRPIASDLENHGLSIGPVRQTLAMPTSKRELSGDRITLRNVWATFTAVIPSRVC